MRLFQFAALAVFIGLLGAALNAQADIDVQVPVGTSITNGAKVKDGKSDNGDIINYTVRIANAGNANLDLLAPVVQGGGYSSVQVTMTNVPVAQTITPGNFLEFDVEIDPDKDSDWKFNITITSSDATDGTFTLRMEGTQGSPDEDDEDCSTSEGGGNALLILLGIFSAAVVATRLRGSRT